MSTVDKRKIFIGHIELAMGFKLYENQIKYILGEIEDPCYDNERGTGKTTTFCIKLALTPGPKLNLKYAEWFSDSQCLCQDMNVRRRYSRDFFIKEFMKIREKLSKYGFAVRGVTYSESYRI